MKRVSRCVVAVLLVAAAFTVFAPRASAAQTRLPDGVCMAVEVGRPSVLIAHLDQFGRALADRPLGRQLRETMDSMGLGAMDRRSPARVLLLEPPLHSLPVFVFRSRDPQKFFNQFQGQLRQQRNGIRTYDLPVPFRAMTAEGNQVLVSGAAAAVQKVQGLIRDGKLGGKRMLPGGDVALCLHPGRLLDGLERMGFNPFDQARQAIRQAQQQGRAEMPAVTMAMVKAELDAVESLVRQTETAMWTASVGADGVQLDPSVTAVKGSGLAKYFARTPGGALRTLRYVPADAVAAFAGKNPGFEEMTEWWIGALKQMSAAQGQESESMKEWADIMRKTVATYGDEMCAFVRLSEDGNPQFGEVIELDDPAAYRGLLPEFDKAMAAFSELQQMGGTRMDMELNPKAARHDGRDIMEWRITVEFGAPEGMPGPQAEQMIEMQQKFFNKLFGGPTMVMHMAFAEDDLLVTGGQGSMDLLKKMMDGRVSPVTESDMWRKHLGADAVRHAGVAYLSLTDLAEGIYGAFATGEEEAGPAPEFPDSPPLVLTSDVSGRTAKSRLTVPTEGMKAMGQAIVMLPPLHRAGQAAKRTSCLKNLKYIGAALAMYQQDHEGLPPTLSALFPGYIGDKKLFVCPADDDPMTLQDGTKCSYHYVGGLPELRNIRDAWGLVVAYDKAGNHIAPTAGRNALFLDYHAEYVREERLQDVLGRGLEILKESDVWNDLSRERKAGLRDFYRGRAE